MRYLERRLLTGFCQIITNFLRKTVKSIKADYFSLFHPAEVGLTGFMNSAHKIYCGWRWGVD